MKNRTGEARPENFFAIVAICFGLLLALITAPFQSPDEPAHFLRIWQLSEGKIVADHYGGKLPTSLGECFVQFLSIPFHPENKTTVQIIVKEFHRPLQLERRQFILFANTAIYSPVPYLPQVLACLVGRVFSLPPIALMYLERFANVIAYAALGWLILSTLPILKWATCLLLLAPTPLFLAGSLSADPITTALTFLVVACILRLIQSPESNRLVALLGICVIATALCKWVYFTAILLLVGVPRVAWGKWRLFTPIAIVSFAILAAGAWSILSAPMHVPLLNGDPQPQLHWMQSQPFQYLQIFSNTIRYQTRSLLWESLGGLGWLDFYLPSKFIIAYLIAIVWSAANDCAPMRITVLLRLTCALAASASIALICACDYLVWNKTGSQIIQGLQGRYFLPLGLMMLVVIRASGRWKLPPMLLKIFAVSSCLYTTRAVFLRYY